MTGPTGVGKSSFAVSLAEQIGGEIIGADAFQIYAGLPLLTAQPSSELLSRVPHHLIGFLSPSESSNAARYAIAARACIQEITARARTPIIVGGTGLYLKALTHGLDDLPAPNEELRRKLADMSLSESLNFLHKIDPEAPQQIDVQNPVRVKRAIEIVLSTGQSLVIHRSTWSQGSKDFRGLILERSRNELREQIVKNVDFMFAAGVVEEVRQVGNITSRGASQAIGFHEIRSLIKEEITQSTCRDLIIKATQRYAKRQLTWCRHQFHFPSLNLTGTTLNNSVEAALQMLNKHQA